MPMKKLLKTISILLTITFVVSSLVACTNSGEENKTTEETKKTTTTTNKETTTEEPTTEEPTTEYVYKGRKFETPIRFKDTFDGFIVKKGDVINVNEICQDLDSPSAMSKRLMTMLFSDINQSKIEEFIETYMPPGVLYPEIYPEDNFCIEYNEDVTLYFHYVESDNEFAYFDRQIIE